MVEMSGDNTTASDSVADRIFSAKPSICGGDSNGGAVPQIHGGETSAAAKTIPPANFIVGRPPIFAATPIANHASAIDATGAASNISMSCAPAWFGISTHQSIQGMPV